MKKLNKIIFLPSKKLLNPSRETTRDSKLGFIMIPCLKFWALASIKLTVITDHVLMAQE